MPTSKSAIEKIIATAHEPMLLLDKDLKVVYANSVFYKKFSLSEPDDKGRRSFHEIRHADFDIPSLKKLLLETLEAKGTVQNHELRYSKDSESSKLVDRKSVV